MIDPVLIIAFLEQKSIRVENDQFLGYCVAVLPVRLMVGHAPLERSIGVRVPDRQQFRKVSKDLEG